MNTTMLAPADNRRPFIRLVFSLVGGVNAVAGALLLVAPEFFLTYIGRFPPLNRHYMGDAGVFALAVGAGMLLVRKAPWKHPAMVTMGLVATQLHAVNHLYDGIFHHSEFSHWLYDIVPTLLLSGSYLAAYVFMRQKSENR